jgi:hypothetical protein
MAQISRYEKPWAFRTSARISCGFSWPRASAPWRSRSSRSACSWVTAVGGGAVTQLAVVRDRRVPLALAPQRERLVLHDRLP